MPGTCLSDFEHILRIRTGIVGTHAPVFFKATLNNSARMACIVSSAQRHHENVAVDRLDERGDKLPKASTITNPATGGYEAMLHVYIFGVNAT